MRGRIADFSGKSAIRHTQVGIAYYFAHKDAIKAERAPITRRLVDGAAPAAGEQVLEIGCGFGDLTIELARRVAPNGFAVGVDLSSAMLETAQSAARAADLENIGFENADAQTWVFEGGSFDLVVSQFGVMFFADPSAAFKNLRSALRATGRIVFVCWQSRERNQLYSVTLDVVARYVPLPPPRPSEAPGQFAFADPERIRTTLEAANFVEVAIEDLREKLSIGGGLGLDEAAHWFIDVEYAANLRQLGAELRPKIVARSSFCFSGDTTSADAKTPAFSTQSQFEQKKNFQPLAPSLVPRLGKKGTRPDLRWRRVVALEIETGESTRIV